MDSFLKQALKGQKYTKIPLLEEGSERRYTRIVLTPHLTKKPQDTSWILACSPLKQQKYFLWRQADFLKAGLNVPKLHPSQKHIATHSSSQKPFLLIEDLGDQSLEKEVLENPNFPLDYYFQALDQLISLQKKGAGAQANKALTLGALGDKKNLLFQAGPIPAPWSPKDLLQEMLWTEKYLIQQFLNYKLQGTEKKMILKEWHEITYKLAHFPYQSGHRDFHSRNLFIKNGQIYMIDFQDAGCFPRFYDAVSLIYDVYVNPKMTTQNQKTLLNYFISKSRILGSKVSIEEEIALTALQRLFQAVGRFAGFYCLKKQTTHLKHIYPGLKKQEQLLNQLGSQGKKHTYPFFLKLIQKLLEKKTT